VNPSPVQLEVDGRRIVRCVRDYFLQYGPQNAFLHCYRGMRMVPELFQVIAQRQQLLALLAVSCGARARDSSKRHSISVTWVKASFHRFSSSAATRRFSGSVA
jgi:hypothetical protein